MKGKLKQFLTTETILSKVSEYDIYRYYLGHDFIGGHKYPSPFRDEKDGSFSIKEMNKGLRHRDFGGDCKGNFIDFVMQLYPGLTFYEVLVKIDADMRLGILNGNEGYRDVVRGYRTNMPKKEKVIQVSTREFDTADLVYWAKYGQNRADLAKNNIFAVKYIRINRVKIHIPPTELAFAYLFNDKYWKVYRPFVRDKNFKWLSTVPLNVAYGLENLNKDNKCLIAKSMKDMLVLKKIYPYVCGVQNESVEAFSEETVNIIRNNSLCAYYGGDCDVPGKKASYAITEKFGFKHINVPDQYMEKGVKDFSDWAAYEGLKKVEHYLKKKKII